MPHRRRPAPLIAAALVTAAAAGCHGPTPSADAGRPTPATAPPTTAPVSPAAAPADPAVAHVGTLAISRGQLDAALYRSYGVNLLFKLVEADLARQELARSGQSLTDADVAAERQRSLAILFPTAPADEYEQYLAQLEQEKHLTAEEFDLTFRTTAALRKLARPQLAGQVSDASVRQAFGLLYGENRRIADMALVNPAEVAEAHARLRKGEPFTQVCDEMNADPMLSGSHGVLPPFAAKNPSVPTAIMEAAFGLKHVGDVSADAISDGKWYHVIKLLDVIPPKLVKFDDVKDSVRRQVEAQLEQSAISQYREQLKRVALAQLEIDDPTLRKAFEALVAAQQPKGTTLNPGAATRQIDRAYHPPVVGPPVVGPPVLRPPATGPATAPAAAGH